MAAAQTAQTETNNPGQIEKIEAQMKELLGHKDVVAREERSKGNHSQPVSDRLQGMIDKYNQK